MSGHLLFVNIMSEIIREPSVFWFNSFFTLGSPLTKVEVGKKTHVLPDPNYPF